MRLETAALRDFERTNRGPDVIACPDNQHPQANSFELAARHGLSLDAGLRKHADKLEQDGGGRHAGDAAGVEGRRDLDEIGADEIEAPQIADQTLGFKCREAARLRRPRPWRIDWIERVDIEVPS